MSSLLTVNNFHADDMFTWGCVRVMSKQTSLESANWPAGLGWSCGKSLASRSVHFYQRYHYHHHIYRTIWLWQKREVTSKHISARTTEWCIDIYKCNSLKSWTEGWHGAKNHLEDDKTMLRSLSQKCFNKDEQLVFKIISNQIYKKND